MPQTYTHRKIRKYDVFSPQAASRLAYSYIAASILAMDHFNRRNSSVVPELGNISETCSFYFDKPMIVDTEANGRAAIRQLWKNTAKTTDMASDGPCAVLGPLSEAAAIQILPAIDALDIPMMNYFREDTAISQEPNTIGLSLSQHGRAKAMVEYFSAEEHLAVWSSASPFRESFIDILENQKGSLELRGIRSQQFESVGEAMKFLDQTGVRTIYCGLQSPMELSGFADALDSAGMLDKGKVFVLPPEVAPPDSLHLLYDGVEPDSALDKLLTGALIFDRLDGFQADPKTDPFLKAWRDQDSKMVAWMNNLVPDSVIFGAAPDFFQVDPVNYASYVYDAVMAIGIGGCILEEAKLERESAMSFIFSATINDSPDPESLQETTMSPPVPVVEAEVFPDAIIPPGLVEIGVELEDDSSFLFGEESEWIDVEGGDNYTTEILLDFNPFQRFNSDALKHSNNTNEEISIEPILLPDALAHPTDTFTDMNNNTPSNLTDMILLPSDGSENSSHAPDVNPDDVSPEENPPLPQGRENLPLHDRLPENDSPHDEEDPRQMPVGEGGSGRSPEEFPPSHADREDLPLHDRRPEDDSPTDEEDPRQMPVGEGGSGRSPEEFPPSHADREDLPLHDRLPEDDSPTDEEDSRQMPVGEGGSGRSPENEEEFPPPHADRDDLPFRDPGPEDDSSNDEDDPRPMPVGEGSSGRSPANEEEFPSTRPDAGDLPADDRDFYPLPADEEGSRPLPSSGEDVQLPLAEDHIQDPPQNILKPAQEIGETIAELFTGDLGEDAKGPLIEENPAQHLEIIPNKEPEETDPSSEDLPIEEPTVEHLSVKEPPIEAQKATDEELESTIVQPSIKKPEPMTQGPPIEEPETEIQDNSSGDLDPAIQEHTEEEPKPMTQEILVQEPDQPDSVTQEPASEELETEIRDDSSEDLNPAIREPTEEEPEPMTQESSDQEPDPAAQEISTDELNPATQYPSNEQGPDLATPEPLKEEPVRQEPPTEEPAQLTQDSYVGEPEPATLEPNDGTEVLKQQPFEGGSIQKPSPEVPDFVQPSMGANPSKDPQNTSTKLPPRHLTRNADNSFVRVNKRSDRPSADGRHRVAEGEEQGDDDVTTLLEGIRKSDFSGASGRIRFGEETGNERDAQDISMGLYNVRRKFNPETNTSEYHSVLVHTYERYEGWVAVPGERIIHRDNMPQSISIEYNDHHMRGDVRAIGLTLMILAWIVSISGSVLVYVLRKDPAVQRAQPFFMQILCWGSFVMSTTIFLLSWDEGAGWNQSQLEMACGLAPWFFFTGQIMTFCALFTKLWRVDEVLQFRRRAITISNVMKPTLGLMCITLALLISWTVIDPWTWVRKDTSYVPPERYGSCQSGMFWYFFGPLVALLLIAESLTLYFAWKTADVPEDFRDSGAVYNASFAQLQSWAVGVPMLAVLGETNADATYFARIFLVWIFAVSSVLVVVGPKVMKAISVRRNPDKGKKSRVQISGLSNPAPSSGRRQQPPSDAKTASVKLSDIDVL